MADTVQLDLDAVYVAWREFMLENSEVKHFGMISDQSVADFPYATLMLIGRPTNVTDLLNNEATIDLTFQTDCYIDSTEHTTLYAMDDACWQFFNNLGFRKMGDSAFSAVDKNVYRISSRFQLSNFNGKFLNEL